VHAFFCVLFYSQQQNMVLFWPWLCKKATYYVPTKNIPYTVGYIQQYYWFDCTDTGWELNWARPWHHLFTVFSFHSWLTFHSYWTELNQHRTDVIWKITLLSSLLCMLYSRIGFCLNHWPLFFLFITVKLLWNHLYYKVVYKGDLTWLMIPLWESKAG